MTQDEADAIGSKLVSYLSYRSVDISTSDIIGMKVLINSFVTTCDCCAPDCVKCNPVGETDPWGDPWSEELKKAKILKAKLDEVKKRSDSAKKPMIVIDGRIQGDMLEELKRKFGN